MERLKYDFFISYPSPEQEKASRLSHLLEASGFTVFWDKKIHPGDRWVETLDAALRSSRIVVVLVSAATRQARNQVDEVIQALAIETTVGSRVVPVFVDKDGIAAAADSVPKLSDRYGILAWEVGGIEGVATELTGLASGSPRQPADDESWVAALALLSRHDSNAVAMAFLIAEDRALTVAHVVAGARAVTLSFPWSRDHPAPVDAEVEVLDTDFDYALLRLRRPITIQPLEVLPGASEGSVWKARFIDLTTGDQLPTPALIPASGRLGKPQVQEFSDSFPRPLLSLEFEAVFASFGGSSGAPVLVDGRVVGIFGYASASQDDETQLAPGLGFCVPIVAPWSDSRVRRQIRPKDRLEDPAVWVAFLGRGAAMSSDDEELATRLGELLATKRAGLITLGGGAA